MNNHHDSITGFTIRRLQKKQSEFIQTVSGCAKGIAWGQLYKGIFIHVSRQFSTVGANIYESAQSYFITK